METRQHVEFAGGNGPRGACRQQLGGGCETGQGGSGLAPRLAGLVAKRRDSQLAARLAGLATTPPRLAGSCAPKPGEGSCAPHLVGLAVERHMQERSRASCVGAERSRAPRAEAKRSGGRRAGVDFVFLLGERRMRQ
jgi:hypothetical protein